MHALRRFCLLGCIAALAYGEIGKKPTADPSEEVRGLTERIVSEIDSGLSRLSTSVRTYGQMKVAKDATVKQTQASILGQFVRLRSKIRTVIDCRAMLDGRRYSSDVMGLAARYNNILAYARLQNASSSQGLFTNSFSLFDEDQALSHAFAYPGMPLGQLPAEVFEGHLRFSRYKAGVAAVYNPFTCSIEVQTRYKSGVAGVYNPRTGNVEWATGYQSGVAGAYNPRSGKIEWEKHYKSGVASAYDAKRGIVVSDHAYKAGVGVVVDPRSGIPVFSHSYKRGVAGYLDASGAPAFHSSYKHGVVLLSLDPEAPTLASASFGSDYGDDDDD